ncbi:MAG: DUF3800 domain-containing protein [Bacillota bacterium]
MKNLHLYTDESGNTGLSLFDDKQPYFWTCTMITEEDFNTVDLSPVLSALQVDRLHANIIGLPGIESISDQLCEIITNKCTFLFTKIEKRYFAKLKLFDLIFDNGINHATTTIHYGIRGLRLPLAYNFVINVSPKSEEEFWESYEKGDKSNFVRLLKRVRWNINHKVHDNRIVQLLTDAINWAISNPDPFLEYRKSRMDSPNVVALTLIINNINSMLDGSDYEIVEFVHDRQNQFAPKIRETFDLLKNTYSETSPETIISDIKIVDSFKCPINILASDNSIGLQITDLSLWLVKRILDKGYGAFSNSKKLFDVITNQSLITHFTLDELKREVYAINKYMQMKPLTYDEIQKGKEIYEQFEMKRIQRLTT